MRVGRCFTGPVQQSNWSMVWRSLLNTMFGARVHASLAIIELSMNRVTVVLTVEDEGM